MEWMDECKEKLQERRRMAEDAKADRKEKQRISAHSEKVWWQRIFSNLKYSLLGLSEDEEHPITEDAVRIWVTQGLSVILSLVCGVMSYFVVGERVTQFHNELLHYEIGSLAEPPGTLWFILNLLWLSAGVLILSTVFVGVQQVLCWLFVIHDVEDAKDVKMTAIAVSCLVYVLTIAISGLLHVPIPGITWL